MNAKKLIAAVIVFAAAGSVFAQGVSTQGVSTQGNSEFVEFTNVPSIKTRAEVRAELAQDRGARGAGLSHAYDDGLLSKTPEFVEHVNIASTRSRAEVRNEAMQAARPTRNSIGGQVRITSGR